VAGGVVVTRVAAQLELGQLGPDVFQAVPVPSRRPDLHVVVRGAGLEASQRERGEGITRLADRELGASVLAVQRVQVVAGVLEPHHLAANQPAPGGRQLVGFADYNLDDIIPGWPRPQLSRPDACHLII